MMEEHGMPGDRDSGLSTSEGSQQSEPPEEELMTISVSQEVKRFQQEINKVAIENTRFHHWKKTRAPVGSLQLQHTVARRSASFESLVEVANPMLDPKDEHQVAPPCLPPRSRFTSQDSLLAAAPALPPRSKPSKRVSYAPQEATVLGSPPESNLVLDLHNKSLERRQRQIFPGSHMAPSEPPAEEEREAFQDEEEEGEKRALRKEESEEPVLPSVRQLASRFQVTFLA